MSEASTTRRRRPVGIGLGLITRSETGSSPAPATRAIRREHPRCVFVYNGRNGGRRGRICGRLESEHCADIYLDCVDRSMAEHSGVCALVHHPFHRPRVCAPRKEAAR
jgi:hypothetical protein